MALTKVTNFDGDVLNQLYLIAEVGNQTIEKGLVFMNTGVPDKRELPFLSISDDPWGVYTTAAPSGDTFTAAKDRRNMEVFPMMLYTEYLPDEFIEEWDQWRSVKSFTDLMLNPALLNDVLSLLSNKSGTQLSKVIWQGDTGGGGDVVFFDGFIKKFLADGDVTDVANIGVITVANVIDVIGDVWAAIPTIFFDDQDFKILMSTIDYKKLQEANNSIKETTVGVLDEKIHRLFLEKRIEHVDGIPENSVVGAVATSSPTSNLHFGSWFTLENENPKIGLVDNAGKLWFIRIDAKFGVQYRTGTEIILYTGTI